MKQLMANESEGKSGTMEEEEKLHSSTAQAMFVDNRPQAIAQLRLNEISTSSVPGIAQRKSESPTASMQGGLPSQLKQGIESLSGMSMDNVKVHYNSSQPAQLNAHAYAQGSDIHVAPGQEKHLPHEAWHVVQQAQGRVQPTMQMKGGIPVNDDNGLEHEADVMGSRALAIGSPAQRMESGATNMGNTDVALTSSVKQLRNNTEIVYQEGTLNWRAQNGLAALRQLPVGINTTALIDPEDPENGERTGAAPANSIYTTPPGGNYAAQNGGTNLTQGHLLNANLGGKAQSYNLFPITAEMNRAHSHIVEDHVKWLVLDIMNKRNTEGSNGAGAVAAAGLATARNRAVDQVSAPINHAAGQAAAGAANAALGGNITAAYGMAPMPAGLIAAIALATGPAVAAAGANESTVAAAAINAALGVGGVTPVDIVNVAQGVAASLAAPPAWAGVAGAAGAAPTALAAAGIFTGAIGAAATAQGIGGTWTARPLDIATAASTAPLAGLPVGGGGAGNWGNARVFYNVAVNAPGINGAVAMRPNTLRQEQFHCTAYQTTNDGVTRNMAGPFINNAIRAPHALNADLAALGFAPSAAPIPGLAISAAVGGVVGALNAPSQHDVVDALGAVVGHATLFKHN